MHRLSFVYFALVAITCTNSLNELSTKYTIALTEFHLNTVDTIANNTRKIVQVIDAVGKLNVDLVVFPENAIFGNDPAKIENSRIKLRTMATKTPEPRDRVIPCGNVTFEPFLQNMSCAARRNKIYVVVNLLEKEECQTNQTNCHGGPGPNDYFLYNADIVFDRNGVVIARYRKFHLIGEIYNVTSPIPVHFTTDFNVTFGLVICYDIMYSEPSLQLIRDGVKNVIFTTRWHNTLPFSFANSFQQGYAWANDVNLFACDCKSPKEGSAGSGIYLGRTGPHTMYMSGANETSIILARFSDENFTSKILHVNDSNGELINESMNQSTYYKPPNTDGSMSDLDKIVLKPTDISGYQHTPINLTAHEQSLNVCHASLCCHADLKINHVTFPNQSTTSNAYKYRLVAFSGYRYADEHAQVGFETCGIVACLNDTYASCGLKFPLYNEIAWLTEFEWIRLRGNFTRSSNTLKMPNSLQSNMKPLEREKWRFDDNGASDMTSYELLQAQRELLTFAIIERNFDWDKSGL